MSQTVTPAKNGDFVVPILRSGSSAMAGYAATDLLDSQSELAEQFGADAFAIWKQWYTDRIEDLTAAISAHCVESFVAQVRWSQAMLVSRGVSQNHLRPALLSLRETLASELPDTAQETLAAYLDPAIDVCGQTDDLLDQQLTPKSPSSKLAASYLVTLLEGNRPQAIQTLQDAVDSGQTVASLMLDVLTPAMHEVGRMWMAGEISIAEEHFVTATARESLTQLVQRSPRKSANGKTVLTAAVAGNHHDLGLQMVADLFELDGWRAINLGANVPPEEIAEAVQTFHADVVVLSAALGNQLPAIQTTIESIRQGEKSGLPVLVGGAGFPASPDLARRLGADGQTDTAQNALELANRLIAD